MDIQRLVLIGALAVVGYLLILQWDKDYYQPTNPQTIQSSTEPTIIDPINAVTDDTVPDISNSELANNNDVADIPNVNSNDIPTVNVVEEKSRNRLITVTTDTLTVTLDKNGGDIIGVDLPKYPLHFDTPTIPFRLLQENATRTYVAKSDLIDTDSKNKSRSIFQSSTHAYSLAENKDSLQVDLTTQKDGLSVTKRFHFKRNSYAVSIEHIVKNLTMENKKIIVFGQIERDTSKDPSAGFNTYLGPALKTNQSKYKKIKFDDIDDIGKFEEQVQGGWIAMVQHYFVSAWIPDASMNNTFQMRPKKNTNNYFLEFISPALDVPAGQTISLTSNFYAGPKQQKQLEALSEGLELTVDYGLLWFISKPLFWLLEFIHSFVQNWGLAIIFLTVLIKTAFLHLSTKSYRSMANMRRLQPKLAQLKERFGSDRQKMSMEMMAFYRKEKINPLGGCLPVIVQIPVFIALYWVLLESVELRQSPFFGWIEDLSIKDPYFVLPLLMGGSMMLQMSLSPSPPDPIQARVMKLMPIFFTVIFLWFPAGLVLYWLVNNVFSIIHQQYINRSTEAKAKIKK